MFHLASIIVSVAITRPYIFLIQVLNNFMIRGQTLRKRIVLWAKGYMRSIHMFFLYVRNYPKFASTKARKSEGLFFLPWLSRSCDKFREHNGISSLSTPNINSSQFNWVSYIGWGCKHIKSLALETAILCARTRCRSTNAYAARLGQLLCRCFCVFSN